MEKDSRGMTDELYRYCLALTGTVWEAEDLMQEAWARGLESGALHGHPNPKALLMTLAKRKWIDLKRRDRTFARIAARLARESAGAHAAAADVRLPGELETMLWTVAKHLLPLQHAVFLLRDVLGLSAAETASLLRTSEGAVKSALFRARQSLRRVREELADDAKDAARPDDDGIRTWLRTLAAGLRQGDVPAVVGLALAGAYEPVVSIQVANRMQRKARTEQPAGIRMSA